MRFMSELMEKYGVLGYPIFILFFEYTGLNAEMMTVLGILLILDIITGVTKAIRLNIKPTSRRGSIGIISKLLLLLVPTVIALVMKSIGVEYAFFITSTVSALIVAEGYSILQNIYAVNTGKNDMEYDVITKILHGTLSKLQKLLDKILGDETSGKGK